MVTAVVRVHNFENPEKPDLPIGLFVNATITGKLENVISLPRAALRNQDQVLVVLGKIKSISAPWKLCAPRKIIF